MTTNKVWFITGSSKGFGRVWAEAALARGDSVVATARDAGTLSDLTRKYGDKVAAVTLDVNDKAAVDAAVSQAHRRFGRLDVVINNAGYGLFGAIEEVSEEEARAQIETNLFGALWVTPGGRARSCARKAPATSSRSRRSVASTRFPTSASTTPRNGALEGFSQALSLEVAEFGIHVTIVEPAGFATDWSGPSAKRAKPIDAYRAARATGWCSAAATWWLAIRPRQERRCWRSSMRPEPPLRVFFGDVGLPMIKQEYANRIANWEKWDYIADMAQGAAKNRKA